MCLAAADRFTILSATASSISRIRFPSALAGAANAAARGPGGAASFLFRGVLRGVAATSVSNAWAVGCTGYDCSDKTDKPLILHWNGSAWRRQDPQALADGRALYGVAATSARDAWAVGQTWSYKTLILHWNGRAWTRVPSPDPLAVSDVLPGVTALSPRSAWAVGWGVPTGGGWRELTMHWNGKAWKVVTEPHSSDHPGRCCRRLGPQRLAVGSFEGNNGATVSLILHRNGTRWARVPSPDPPDRQAGGGAGFLAVAAGTARSAWAVGSGGTGPGTLIARWNGSVWRQVPTPRSGIWDALLGRDRSVRRQRLGRRLPVPSALPGHVADRCRAHPPLERHRLEPGADFTEPVADART